MKLHNGNSIGFSLVRNKIVICTASERTRRSQHNCVQCNNVIFSNFFLFFILRLRLVIVDKEQCLDYRVWITFYYPGNSTVRLSVLLDQNNFAFDSWALWSLLFSMSSKGFGGDLEEGNPCCEIDPEDLRERKTKLSDPSYFQFSSSTKGPSEISRHLPTTWQEPLVSRILSLLSANLVFFHLYPKLPRLTFLIFLCPRKFRECSWALVDFSFRSWTIYPNIRRIVFGLVRDTQQLSRLYKIPFRFLYRWTPTGTSVATSQVLFRWPLHF